MNSARSENTNVLSFGKDTSIRHYIEPMRKYLEDDSITEICVNKPGEVFTEANSTWTRHDSPALTMTHLLSLATALAAFNDTDISETRPILSGPMPDGERIEVVMPPACRPDTIAMTIRKPSKTERTLEQYESQGYFESLRPVSGNLNAGEIELLSLKDTGNIKDFLRRSVQLDKVIVVAGATGSGKTTLMKALVMEIAAEQRLITIEDVPELTLGGHANHVRLFYPQKSGSETKVIVTPADLLRSCLRMKPDRILLAELRGGEAFDFINVCASGHGGSITSVHAGSAQLAIERLCNMVLENPMGRALGYDVVRHLIYLVVDVIIHVDNDTSHGGFGRHITEVWFDPLRKLKGDKVESVVGAHAALMQAKENDNG